LVSAIQDAILSPHRDYLMELKKLSSAWITYREHCERNLLQVLAEQPSDISSNQVRMMGTEIQNFNSQPVPTGLRQRSKQSKNDSETFENEPRANFEEYESRFYAELRAWQKAHFALMYVEFAVTAFKFNPDALDSLRITPPEALSPAHKLIWAGLQDLELLGPPPPLGWATPQSDDRERVLDRRQPLEEPSLVEVRAACPPDMQARINKTREVVAASLPAFPKFLSGVGAPRRWDPKTVASNASSCQ